MLEKDFLVEDLNKKLHFDGLTILVILMFLFAGMLFTGCAQKEVVVKTIKPSYPKLKVYDSNISLKLTAYNKGEKVCVKEWNSCIPKKQMIDLITYTHTLKKIIKHYEDEIKKYNEFADKKNKERNESLKGSF